MKLICPKNRQPDFNVDCLVWKCEEGQLFIGRYTTCKDWHFVWWCFETGNFSKVGETFKTKAEIKFNARFYAKTQWCAPDEDILI